MRFSRSLAAVTLSFATVTAPAIADTPIGGSIGVSLAPLIGEHIEASATSHLPPIPIPILQASGRVSQIELFAEALPGSPAIDEVGNRQTLSTSLAFFDAVVRGYTSRDRVFAGVGEIVYNQLTRYSPPGIVNASRVVGGRYELGAGLLRDARRVRLWLDVMPALLGNVDQSFRGEYISAPERGAQFETQLAIDNTHGPFAFDYGVRYVNYATRFRNGVLADRNVGFLPYATFAIRVGR